MIDVGKVNCRIFTSTDFHGWCLRLYVNFNKEYQCKSFMLLPELKTDLIYSSTVETRELCNFAVSLNPSMD